MTALTQDRNTSRRDGNQVEPPVAAATRIWGGSIVCINAGGYAVPGATATTLKAVGVAEDRADNSAGVAGAIRVRCRKGPHRFANSAAADAIALSVSSSRIPCPPCSLFNLRRPGRHPLRPVPGPARRAAAGTTGAARPR